MEIYIALLRGINVGGHRKIPMADLRGLLTKMGFNNVQTYIQSGNVIFQSSKDTKTLEITIKQAIANRFGFDVPVIVKTRADIKTIFDNCPFPETKKTNSYYTLLSHQPDIDLVKIASEKTYPNEEYQILNDCIYFYAEKGYGNAKFNLNWFEKTLNVNATARNYKTMLKLLSLSEN
ncbi:DUF1697 domain-containing protein [Winogradskyella immobilis]|uniref:DUF1697 domain-containing protein n=1 Tax=Winogradskyella immobilis TaxID=2816852 RepID=A0ABS8ELD2_9FLAO|nr:DUF1697 domain-containing protein [Winogradskyella immobilis]MCC1483117.1 DUF1697 domain-containing protein [Winogradskyella immobilis]MCG0015212.1 DUF1697 domain-containing protein [Winogradskyella immobilis]